MLPFTDAQFHNDSTFVKKNKKKKENLESDLDSESENFGLESDYDSGIRGPNTFLDLNSFSIVFFTKP